MQLGLVGLGKMGGNMRERIRRAGHEVVGYDRNKAVSDASSLADMVRQLDAPRVVWVMVPHGAPTRDTVAELAELLDKGDLVIDGGNSKFTEDFENEKLLKAKGIGYLDCGVSGGIWGLDNGYGLMVGGDVAAVRAIEPVLRALAPAEDRGWVHCGPAGAGHFTKMVHNGIEYGLMQAYAEGLALMRAKSEFALDLPRITEAWRHGTVIRSWLLDLTAEFLAHDATLESTVPFVADSVEGRWTAIESIELGVPTPVMTLSLMERFASQGKVDFTNRLLARMRQAFGGHAVQTK